MRYAYIHTAMLLATVVSVGACNRQEPVRETTNESVAESVQERNKDAAELEKRVVDVELKWSEMQSRVQEKNRTPTAALRDEVKEDVAAVREAVENLKTTTTENWWERHEEATERTIDDIAADVRRFAPAAATSSRDNVRADPVGTTASFDQRRADFVARERARIDAFEDQLRNVKADGPRQTELEDTRARIDKLQDDLDRLRTVEAKDWWDVSEKRVSEYIDRLERSIARLDDDKATASQATTNR